MERDPSELYEELAVARANTERIARSIADIGSAVQYFTHRLVEQPNDPEVAAEIERVARYLNRLMQITEPVATDPEADATLSAGYHDRDQDQPRPPLPEMVAWRVETLLRTLQADARVLSGVRQSGAEAVLAWWQKHLPMVRDNLQQLELLEETAAEQGVELRLWLNDLGGIPESLTSQHWPEAAISSEEDPEPQEAGGEDQKQLFSTSDQEPVIAAVPASAESRLSQGREGMDNLDSHHRPQQHTANSKPLSEAIYAPSAYVDRVAYAKHCLLDGDTDHRDFDTCFEMFDGEFVVARLIQLSKSDPQLAEAIAPFRWAEQEGDLQDFVDLSLEELTERARLAVEARQTPAGPSDTSTPEADKTEEVASEPYSVDRWRSAMERLDEGQLTLEQLQSEYQAMNSEKPAIVEELVRSNNAKQLKQWCQRWGRRADGKKADNAETIVNGMLQSFAIGQSVVYRPFDGESYDDAVSKAVASITEEELQEYLDGIRRKREETEKALSDPETLQEWELYVRSVGGYRQLDEGRKVLYERVRADASRTERANRQATQVAQLQLDEDLAFTIKEGYHDKKQKPLWIVQLSNRVERATFGELKAKAQSFGGWYSSFKKSDEGFQFYDEAAAKLFTDLLDGDVDNSDAVEARRIRKMTNASERLNAVADTLQQRCNQVLTDDESKLKNTARRASMAASMREDAQAGLATVKTLRSLAGRLEAGEIEYLNGINAATQLYTLTQLLRSGKQERIRQELAALRDGDRTGVTSHLRYEMLNAQPLCEADIGFVEYPHPHIYREHLDQALLQLQSTPGVKRSTAKMRRLVKSADPEQSMLEFKNERAVEILADFLQRAKAAGYDCYWFDHCLERYKRMRAANIHNVFELRTALRELLPHVATPDGDDPVMRAEDALRGRKLDGFFPTPPRVISQMLQHADIAGTDRVLEPSAGKGDILDAISRAHPDIELHGIEYNQTLRDVLTAKGYDDVRFEDFLEHDGRYDKIVMNPPFESGADIAHVRHAYELLSEGGRLVAIMSQGPFFRSDSKSQAFRAWLEEHDLAHDEELPEDAFAGSDAFRQTGVRTRLLVIDKPAS